MQRDERGAWTLLSQLWLAAWSCHPVTALMIKHDDSRKQAKSGRRV
jgi:hypothetical protein